MSQGFLRLSALMKGTAQQLWKVTKLLPLSWEAFYPPPPTTAVYHDQLCMKCIKPCTPIPVTDTVVHVPKHASNSVNIVGGVLGFIIIRDTAYNSGVPYKTKTAQTRDPLVQ